jgi:hypothetical protein
MPPQMPARAAISSRNFLYHFDTPTTIRQYHVQRSLAYLSQFSSAYSRALLKNVDGI